MIGLKRALTWSDEKGPRVVVTVFGATWVHALSAHPPFVENFAAEGSILAHAAVFS